MPNFVYDVVILNGSKQNRSPIPGGEDPNKWIQATQDWNPAIAASNDLKGAVINNRFFGLQQLAVEPAVPAGGATDFLWLRNDGTLFAKVNGVNQQINGGGSSGANFFVNFAAFPAPGGVPGQLAVADDTKLLYIAGYGAWWPISVLQ